jgi:hypothetical protein
MRLRTAARIACAAVMIGSVGSLVPMNVGVAGANEPSWHLVGHHQRACFDGNVHDAWYGVFIKGTWTHDITVGVTGLPAGGTFSTSYTPIAAGASRGRLTLAYADAKLPSGTPVGTYTARLWASDGTTRDHVRIELDVSADCGY